jgi:predicted Zn-dependent protease
MSRLLRVIPPLAARLAAARPVLSEEQVMTLAKRVMSMTSADTVHVYVIHTAQVVTRMANDQVLSGDDGDRLQIQLWTRFGGRAGVNVITNQLDDTVLLAAVRRCEALARVNLGPDEEARPETRQVQDTLVPVSLWHEETIRAMTTTRDTVVPEIIDAVTRERLSAAGFVGLMARSRAMITKEGIHVFSEETDSEVTITARTTDGKSSGWGGQAARNWTKIHHADIAARAVAMAKMGRTPVALEPGRRTAILGPAAIAQMLRFLAAEFDAVGAHRGETALARVPRGTKLGQRIFDSRINMRSDPADPDGGYCPYFGNGYATPAMSWVENGILKNLAYDPLAAMDHGTIYSALPSSIRIAGGMTSIDQMIAQCPEGVYVNRMSDVEMLNLRTAVMTGVTRDGCFLIKDGKIDRPIKNFRFMESPFFFLNKIEALGPTERTAFGYTPPALQFDRGPTDWPRNPMIVPPMMVHDFNFTTLADAV